MEKKEELKARFIYSLAEAKEILNRTFSRSRKELKVAKLEIDPFCFGKSLVRNKDLPQIEKNRKVARNQKKKWVLVSFMFSPNIYKNISRKVCNLGRKIKCRDDDGIKLLLGFGSYLILSYLDVLFGTVCHCL